MHQAALASFFGAPQWEQAVRPFADPSGSYVAVMGQALGLKFCDECQSPPTLGQRPCRDVIGEFYFFLKKSVA
jgi:hypothetical protein